MNLLDPKNIKRGKYINISTREARPCRDDFEAVKQWHHANRAGFFCDYNERTNALSLSHMANLSGEPSFIQMDNVFVVMA